MREQLKRELNKTYLILSSEGEQYEETYELEMIIKNTPQTILPLHVVRIDSRMEMYYDISSKQHLKDCAERVKLNGATIRKLFETIDLLIREMREYLLDIESVLFDLQYIYTKEGCFYFCYCPWKKQDVLNSFRSMLEDILGKLDYHDTEGVELTYHLYQSACKGDFYLSDILKEHQKMMEVPEEYIFEYEEEPEELFCRSEEKEQIQEKKPGILRKILQFFMKKPESKVTEDQMEDLQEELTGVYPGISGLPVNDTEVLERQDNNTVLLENMPKGFWRLRPLMAGCEEFYITKNSFLIGKKKESVDGCIQRDTVSRIHSRLVLRGKRLFVADINSTNGTFVNGIAVEPGSEVEIFAGDRILFADVGYECYNSL